MRINFLRVGFLEQIMHKVVTSVWVVCEQTFEMRLQRLSVVESNNFQVYFYTIFVYWTLFTLKD